MQGIPDLEPLEQSVLEMALDSGLTEGISHLVPLEHSVLDVNLDGGLAKGDGVLKFGLDRKLTLSEIPHAMRNDELMVVIRMWDPWRILNGTLGRTRVL